jgi:hypothetical protein
MLLQHNRTQHGMGGIDESFRDGDCGSFNSMSASPVLRRRAAPA